MELVNHDCRLIKQKPGMDGVYDIIEECARVCYKSKGRYKYVPYADCSEDELKEDPEELYRLGRAERFSDSAEGMVNALIRSHHNAMLEHATIYLTIYDKETLKPFIHNYWTKIIEKNLYGQIIYYVTTNYRVIIENELEPYLDIHMVDTPSEHHMLRQTVDMIEDIAIVRDFLRHRLFSFANESTRYVNYMKDKFGNSVTFIDPIWIKPEDIDEYANDCKIIEGLYFKWLNKGYKPEEARNFLTLGVKSELIMTGFIDDFYENPLDKQLWGHFFDLRMRETTGKPHPQAKDMAVKIYKLFKDNGLV